MSHESGIRRGDVTEVPGVEDLDEIERSTWWTRYRGADTERRDPVAVTVLSGSLEEGTVATVGNDLEVARSISAHPNLDPVHRHGLTGDEHVYVVTDRLEGSLADRLESIGTAASETPGDAADSGAAPESDDDTGRMRWPETVRVGVKIAGALETIHAAGLVHGGIEPATLRISEFFEPKLGDIGLAAARPAPGEPGSASPALTPPELRAGGSPDAPSDVWSLGASLFTLLSGNPPFPDEDDDAFRAAVEAGPPDLRARGVPEEVCIVLERALGPSVEDRPRSAADLGRDLQQAQRACGLTPAEMQTSADVVPETPPETWVAGEATEGASPAPHLTPTPKDSGARSRLWKGVVGAMIAVGLAVVALGAVVIFGGGDEEEPVAASTTAPPVGREIYENEDAGVRLNVPADWTIDEETPGIVAGFLEPKLRTDDQFQENVLLAVEPGRSGITLEEQVRKDREQVMEDFPDAVFSKEETARLGRLPALALEYTAASKGVPLRVRRVVAVHDGRVHRLVLTAADDDYERVLGVFEEMGDSFELVTSAPSGNLQAADLDTEILEGALLVAADVPPGWKRVTAGSGFTPIGAGAIGVCGEAPEPEGVARERKASWFDPAGGLRIVHSALTTFDEGEAEAYLDAVEAAAVSCQSWVEDLSGKQVTSTVTAVSREPVPAGEELILRIDSTTADGQAFLRDYRLVRHRDTVALTALEVIGPTDESTSIFAPAAGRMEANLERIFGL